MSKKSENRKLIEIRSRGINEKSIRRLRSQKIEN